MFNIGSVLFLIVGIALLVPEVADSVTLSTRFGIVAGVGSVLFFFGGTAQLLEVLQAPVTLGDPAMTRLIASDNDRHV